MDIFLLPHPLDATSHHLRDLVTLLLEDCAWALVETILQVEFLCSSFFGLLHLQYIIKVAMCLFPREEKIILHIFVSF